MTDDRIVLSVSERTTIRALLTVLLGSRRRKEQLRAELSKLDESDRLHTDVLQEMVHNIAERAGVDPDRAALVAQENGEVYIRVNPEIKES